MTGIRANEKTTRHQSVAELPAPVFPAEFFQQISGHVLERYVLALAELAVLKETPAQSEVAQLLVACKLQRQLLLDAERQRDELQKREAALMKEVDDITMAFNSYKSSVKDEFSAKKSPTNSKKISLSIDPHAEQLDEDVWTDTKTGLMWVRRSVGSVVLGGVAKSMAVRAQAYSWSAAVRACADCRTAGHRDWRIPSIDELKTLMRAQKAGYACPVGVLVKPANDDWGRYWSSNRTLHITKIADFNSGNVQHARNTKTRYWLRVVRNAR